MTSMNNTFRECRSKVNIAGLLSDLGTLTATTLPVLGLSRWNKNWNVRNSCSYVATTTKIRFHVATLKIVRFLLKTHCRRRGWWYHVPHSSSHYVHWFILFEQLVSIFDSWTADRLFGWLFSYINNLSIQEWKHITFLRSCEISYV